jgi:hypothetical protein
MRTIDTTKAHELGFILWPPDTWVKPAGNGHSFLVLSDLDFSLITIPDHPVQVPGNPIPGHPGPLVPPHHVPGTQVPGHHHEHPTEPVPEPTYTAILLVLAFVLLMVGRLRRLRRVS